MKKALVFLGLMGVATAPVAIAEPVLQKPAERVSLEHLAHSPEWYALLYYRNGLGGPESEADDPTFFLSPQGKHDPLAELQAHLTAFAQATPVDDTHPQCRFPARYHWLRQQVRPLMQGVVDRPCPAFSAFHQRLGAKGVTMVYPVPNMDDVSTLFGHSFLRLDRDLSPTVDKSEDYTLNFAALLKKGYGQSDLVTKGLSGELEGVFTVLPYGKKLNEYLHMEARDIWEYRLNLTEAETAQLVRHAWEVRKAHFDYEFFYENCSYRMLNFIDVARPGLALHEQPSLYIAPLEAVETVIAADLVNNVHYQPSMETRWIAVAEQLSEEEIAQFRAGALPAQRMAVPEHVVESLKPGDVGHMSARVQVSGGVREGLNVATLSLRPAYHDFLDGPMGGPLAEITVMELTVRQIEEQAVELTGLTVFAASSLKARNALYSPWSWQLSSGVTGRRVWDGQVLDRHALDSETPASIDSALSEAEQFQQALEQSDWINPLYLRALAGPAWGSTHLAFYELLGAEVQAAGTFEHGSEALILWHQGLVARAEKWQGQIEVALRDSASTHERATGSAKASLTRALGINAALFLEGEREKDVLGYQNEWRLGTSLYF